ncbi:RNA-binding (RRM/RBD/RNP motifs) family protein isoform X2 [Tasmannia lanceolata]|uniref:RNA-binding (RRM/RBD/RNP motifs) family protein isoform X2 n=1 Tax=Tasmannia lanceolata TaxID=3420 RepID=UPI004063B70E
MPRNKDEPPAVRVYTVCDESRYLIVRNVPALGCGDELAKLCGSYGEIEECKPMDGEDCEPFTDVYWIKFLQVNNARLQVSYAPHFESLSDTKEKLEGRRKEVLSRINPGRSNRPKPQISNCPYNPATSTQPLLTQDPSPINCLPQQINSKQRQFEGGDLFISRVSSNQEYFSSPSMNQTVQLVREKLDKVQSSSEHIEAGPVLKKTRVDNRRRI